MDYLQLVFWLFIFTLTYPYYAIKARAKHHPVPGYWLGIQTIVIGFMSFKMCDELVKSILRGQHEQH